MRLLTKLLAVDMFLLVHIIYVNGEKLNITQVYKKEEIVSDILDKAPKDFLTVKYNNKSIKFAEELTPTQVKEAPKIGWGLDSTAFYTLVMIDPDVPSKAQSAKCEFLNWLVVNIPGYDFKLGQTLAAYIGAVPSKNTGMHRYIFTVYRQPSRIGFGETPINDTTIVERKGFVLRKFVFKYKLEDPYLGNMFKAHYDDFVPEFYQQKALNPLSFI